MPNAPSQNQISLCALSLPDAVEGEVPEWVHLLPAGEIATEDRRGPYHVTDIQQVITNSMANGVELPIDQDHAIDLAAPHGRPAPAHGWIAELQARTDGIWGRIKWNESGAELVRSRAYRALSPVLLHSKSKRITHILRASLVTRPNLRGLTALNHQENDAMSFQERMAELLGLGADASETAIQSALETLADGPDATALQSQIDEIGTALGVEGDGDILAAAKAAVTGGDGETETSLQQAVTALQAENVDLAKQLKTLSDGTSRAAAEAFIDGEIRKGRAGVKPLRDHYVSMHMEDAARVEKEIGALPVLTGSILATTPPVTKDGEIALNAEQISAANMLGIPLEDYKKTLKEEAA